MRPPSALVLALVLLALGFVALRALSKDDRAARDVDPARALGRESDTRDGLMPPDSLAETASPDETRSAIEAGADGEATLELAHMRVRVRTERSGGEGAEPVGGVRVRVGFARRGRALETRVRGTHASALPKPPAGWFEPVAATTGANGEVGLELALPAAWLEPDEKHEVVLWGELCEAGFRRSTAERAIEPPFVGTPGLALEAGRGGTVEGRLVNADGAAIAGVRMTLLQHDGDAPGGWASTYSGCVTSDDGRFTLDDDEYGRRAVIGMLQGLGSAFRDDVELAEDGVRVAGELDAVAVVTMRGEGVLTGVVVDPTGAPVRGYRVWALPRERTEPKLNDTTRFQEVRADGLMDGEAATGPDGAFRITGLRARSEDGWHLWGYDGVESELRPRLTDAPVAIGREDLRLVAARATLVVRVLDERGAPLKPRIAPRHRFAVEEAIEVSCARASEDGRLDREFSHRDVAGRGLADDTIAYAVEAGAPYLVTAGSLRRAHRSAVVRVERGSFETVVELRLPPETEPATLVLHVTDPRGEPFAQTTNVTVRALDTDEVLHATERWFQGPAFTAALPPGLYRVHVDADPPGGQHGERGLATPHAPVEREVVLRAGELTALDVQLGASGRLRALVRLPTGPLVDEPDPSAPAERREWIRGAGIVLVPLDGGTPLRPIFEVGGLAGTGMPVHIGGVQTSKAPDGVEVTSVNAIPVGRYTARLTAPGCRTVEREIEIRAGEVTRVEAALEGR